jgi:hypothetical protein
MRRPSLKRTPATQRTNPASHRFERRSRSVNAPKAFVDGSKALHDGENDNYFLGGYAGI